MFKSFIFIFFIITTLACASTEYPLSDHYDGKKFYNQDRTTSSGKNFLQVLKWKIFETQKTWQEFVEDNAQPDFSKSYGKNQGAITFINHASEFIQLEDLNIITDPIFSDRASPFTWVGPHRHRHPGASLMDLPRIDVVIVSHNHYDHLDIASLKAIHQKDQPQFIVPLGNKKLLNENGIDNVIELDWWQNFKTKNGAMITLVPMQHWSARGLFDRSETLWGGYVIEKSALKILFCGDTGYNRQYKEIEQKFGPMDVSLIPIGAYEPRWFMKDSHMNPDDAVQAHLDLKSKLSVGMHYGTFQLTDEAMEDPVIDLKTSLEKFNINPKVFLSPKNGETIFFGK